MGKIHELIGAGVSRRTFMQGMTALGAAAAVSGCSKGNDGEVVYINGGGKAVS